MYDFHSHTHYSGDCEVPPERMIESAIKKGLFGLAITDHVDYDYPHPSPDFDMDLEQHFQAILALKEQHAEQLFVAIGLEIGYQKSCEEKADRAVQGRDYDFILCSIHTIDGADLYYGDFFKNKSPKEALCLYFKALTEMVLSFDNWDVLGHLDLPRRYHKPINEVPLSAYKEELTTLLTAIIAADKAIEFNTSGYRYGDDGPYPHFEIARLYFALGGRKITLGSDAHRPEDIAHQFYETSKALKDIGFTEAYYYNKRKPIPYAL